MFRPVNVDRGPRGECRVNAIYGVQSYSFSWDCTLAPAFGEPVHVQGARIASQSGKTRVALDLSRPAEHKIFTLSNPSRVVIDIKPGRITKRALPLPAGTGAVSRIRSANREDGSVRLVLDLKVPVKPRSFLLAGNGQQGDRLVIDLEPVDTASVMKKSAVRCK